MTEQKIIEAMARLDGINIFVGENGIYSPKGCDIPNYLEDHNAVQRVIDGLDSLTLCEFYYTLEDMFEEFQPYNVGMLLKATAAQKCEAILKAKGLWKEDD